MRLPALCCTVVSVIVLSSCSPAPEPPEDTSQADLATLRASTDVFLTAWNAADVDALGAQLAEDVIRISPDGPPTEGRAVVMQQMREYFDEFDAVQTANQDEVSVHGDLAVLRGTWSVTETPKAGGATVERSGKWLVVQRRQADGSWQMWRWMWNQPTAAEEG